MAQMSKLAFKAAIKGLRIRVHRHPPPKCAGGKHDPECSTRGKEVSCNQVTWKKVKVCLCTHIKA